MRSKDPHYGNIVKQMQQWNGGGAPHEIEAEDASNLRGLRIYEAKFDGGKGIQDPNCFRSPLDISLDVLRFRNQGIRQILNSSTCLSSTYVGSELQPVFQSIPYFDSSTENQETMGLHGGVSLYHKDGRKLFSENPAIEAAITQRFLEIQNMAGLAFVQNEMSAQRFGANESTPKSISFGKDKYSGATILERQNVGEGGGERYLENRMMGAGADTLVTTAFELAAIYDVIAKWEKEPAWISRKKFEKSWPRIEDDNSELSASLIGWVERFENNEDELKALLGKDLCDGILEHYGRNGHVI